MQRNPLLPLPGLCLLACCSGVAGAADLTLRIHNVSSAGGTVMVEVLASEAAFAGAMPAAAAFIVPATAPTVTVSTNALAVGEYAVRVFQDINGNGKLDTNLVGRPTEPWGFSNDASGTFGPPGWTAARFRLEADAVNEINLKR
ncbi:MAG: DUF2141 domain-containing protein [Gammaproteobacteria bacterium]